MLKFAALGRSGTFKGIALHLRRYGYQKLELVGNLKKKKKKKDMSLEWI